MTSRSTGRGEAHRKAACWRSSTRSAVVACRSSTPAAIAIEQAVHAVDELRRLAGLLPAWDWSKAAVIAREWSLLMPVRSYCEALGIPVQMANDELPSFWRLRETQALIAWVQEQRQHDQRRRSCRMARATGIGVLVGDPEGRHRRACRRARRRRPPRQGPARVAGRMGARLPPQADGPAAPDRAPGEGARVRPCRRPRRRMGAPVSRRGSGCCAAALLCRHDPGQAGPDADVSGLAPGTRC